MILVSSWPARPTNGSPLRIFVRAGRFTDEHQIRVRIADPEHGLGARCREVRAFDAKERLAPGSPPGAKLYHQPRALELPAGWR